MTPMTVPGDRLNSELFRHFQIEKGYSFKITVELMGATDCLLRNIFSFEYLLQIDADEVVVPTRHVVQCTTQHFISPYVRG